MERKRESQWEAFIRSAASNQERGPGLCERIFVAKKSEKVLSEHVRERRKRGCGEREREREREK